MHCLFLFTVMGYSSENKDNYDILIKMQDCYSCVNNNGKNKDRVSVHRD